MWNLWVIVVFASAFIVKNKRKKPRVYRFTFISVERFKHFFSSQLTRSCCQFLFTYKWMDGNISEMWKHRAKQRKTGRNLHCDIGAGSARARWSRIQHFFPLKSEKRVIAIVSLPYLLLIRFFFLHFAHISSYLFSIGGPLTQFRRAEEWKSVIYETGVWYVFIHIHSVMIHLTYFFDSTRDQVHTTHTTHTMDVRRGRTATISHREEFVHVSFHLKL